MCGRPDGMVSQIETAARPERTGMKALTLPARKQRLSVALAIALVCLAYAGVARAEDQVAVAPASEAPPAPAEPPAEDPASEPPPAPAEPPAEDPASEPPPAPAEPPAEDPASEPPPAPAEPPAEDPASEPPPAPAEPPAEDPASEPPPAPAEPPAEDPASEAPAAPVGSGSGDSIVVIDSAVTAPGIDAASLMPSSDSPAGAMIDGEASVLRSDPGRSKRASPSGPDPQQLPPAPQAPMPAGAGASGGSGGGFSGGLFAALVGSLILAIPGLGRVLSLSFTPLRAPTLVVDLERPD